MATVAAHQPGKSPNLSQPRSKTLWVTLYFPVGNGSDGTMEPYRMEHNSRHAAPTSYSLGHEGRERGKTGGLPSPECQMQKGPLEALSTLFRSPFSACTKARLLGPYGLVQWRSRASLHQIFIKINNPRQLLRRKLCCSSAAGRRGCHT